MSNSERKKHAWQKNVAESRQGSLIFLPSVFLPPRATREIVLNSLLHALCSALPSDRVNTNGQALLPGSAYATLVSVIVMKPLACSPLRIAANSSSVSFF